MSAPTRIITRPVLLSVLAVLLVGLSSTAADAQRRRPSRTRAVVIVRTVPVRPLGYGYALQRGYPWGSPWGPWPPYGYGYGVRDVETSSLRLDISPKDAEVFVDGYLAGRVDDFDGIFQRLRLEPGAHQLTIYLEGYRTIRQDLYLSPNSDQKVTYEMERLVAGEAAEPPPAPVDGGRPIDEPARSTGRQAPPVRAAAGFGTLSIRVQPADAEVFVDGERWSAPAGQERLAIRLTTGEHHVEVRRDGFATYSEDIVVDSGRTLALNVSLLDGSN